MAKIIVKLSSEEIEILNGLAKLDKCKVPNYIKNKLEYEIEKMYSNLEKNETFY